MPRSLDDEDYRKHALIYALIHIHGESFQRFEEDNINKMMPRYLRELTKLEIIYPPFYPDIVSGRYDDVYQAIVQGYAFDFFTLQMNSRRIPIATNLMWVLARGNEITADEMPRILIAARNTNQCYYDRTLNDDIPSKSPR